MRRNLFTNPVFLVLTGSVTHPTAETKCSWGEFTWGLSWHIKERLKRLKALWSLKARKQHKLRACYSLKYSEKQVCCVALLKQEQIEIYSKKQKNKKTRSWCSQSNMCTVFTCKCCRGTDAQITHGSCRVAHLIKEKKGVAERIQITKKKHSRAACSQVLYKKDIFCAGGQC